MGKSALDVVIGIFQLYFLLMNATVERAYCAGPLGNGFLHKVTIDFCSQHNKLFLERPVWMINATCFSAWGLSLLYLFILYNVFTDWHLMAYARWQMFSLLFVGAKVYAILFYHYMEFTSASPPQNLLSYFSVEGPYLISIILVLFKINTLMLTKKVIKNNVD